MLDPSMFREACRRLNFKPDIDLFASQKHHQVSRYCSLYPDSNAFCTHVFTLDWSQFRSYINPPWPMIPRILRYLVKCQARALVLIPYWTSVSWFTLWTKLLVKTWLVTDPLYLDNQGNLRPKPKWSSCFAILDGSRISYVDLSSYLELMITEDDELEPVEKEKRKKE